MYAPKEQPPGRSNATWPWTMMPLRIVREKRWFDAVESSLSIVETFAKKTVALFAFLSFSFLYPSFSPLRRQQTRATTSSNKRNKRLRSAEHFLSTYAFPGSASNLAENIRRVVWKGRRVEIPKWDSVYTPSRGEWWCDTIFEASRIRRFAVSVVPILRIFLNALMYVITLVCHIRACV